ncbi:MAG: hypothetical protein EOO89_06530 [Pedobacter sp.]|nr:MAG: hypothetical protein EOO89_06530 [Pedobacter sp.]
MENDKEKLNLLLLKLENLSLRQQHFEAEIQDLRNQIRQLQFPGDIVEHTQPAPVLQEQKIVSS